MRGAGPKGYPGGAEVVNMRAPIHLLKQGVHELPCIGEGRQSGTSGSPSILNAAREAAENGGPAVLQTGGLIRIDLNACTVNVLMSEAELKQGKTPLMKDGGYPVPGNPNSLATAFPRTGRPL